MRKAIRKLRLRQGDILVVSDYEMVKSLRDIGQVLKLGFDVPIIVVPPGFSCKRICKDYALKAAREIVGEEKPLDNSKKV